ncbi:MAG: HD domain-containing protein [Candidatus Stygibacter australis]|nr:HD domain-containing protein [Candidatus Stygibacter australis]
MEYKNLRNWFDEYTSDYAEGTDRHNIILKIEHTQRVVSDINEIGIELGLTRTRLDLAKIIGLLHDIGRFEQYRRYGTFSDTKSIDHAELGVEIIIEKEILQDLPQGIREIVLNSIKYHNKLTIPENESEELIFYSKLLRDADKLDIFKVVTDYYKIRYLGRNETLELDLPETGDVSRIVYESVKQRQPVDFKMIKNLNDFKLLQAGWVFEVNFIPTIRLFKERGYLSMIEDSLPSDEGLGEIFQMIRVYIEQKLL